jgi:hypothetical protein
LGITASKHVQRCILKDIVNDYWRRTSFCLKRFASFMHQAHLLKIHNNNSFSAMLLIQA